MRTSQSSQKPRNRRLFEQACHWKTEGFLHRAHLTREMPISVYGFVLP